MEREPNKFVAEELIERLQRILMQDDIEVVDELREKNTKFNYFPTKREQQELFAAVKKICNFINEKEISNLVLVDASARPAFHGIHEYMKQIYPEHKLDTYFINPHYFKEGEKFEDIVLLDEKLLSEGAKDRTDSKVSEFSETYKGLVTKKDQPTLIFDTCSHTSNTFAYLKYIFNEAGFDDVYLGAVDVPPPSLKQKMDLVVFDKTPRKGCYPFGKERIIKSSGESILSSKENNIGMIEEAKVLRKEIVGIINSSLEDKSV